MLPEYKLIDLTFGNVSVAEQERRVFAIKPSGVDYSAMKVNDIVVVDFEGKMIEGSLRPSSDTPTHCRLFQAFEGIRSVVHTHSRNAVAFARVGRAIPCFGTTHAGYFYGEVPVTRPMTAEEIQSAYELETASRLIRNLNGHIAGDTPVFGDCRAIPPQVPTPVFHSPLLPPAISSQSNSSSIR